MPPAPSRSSARSSSSFCHSRSKNSTAVSIAAPRSCTFWSSAPVSGSSVAAEKRSIA
jgi:hypothetical protein